MDDSTMIFLKCKIAINEEEHNQYPARPAVLMALALSTAMCKPGEVYCGSGQCRPHGSQCNLQACGDSSEETNCGNVAPFPT